MLKIGSHVGMNGKNMMLASVEEALSYDANTFMLYTGAPQNTRRKELSELNIDAAKALMKEKGIEEFIVHAPYIINLPIRSNRRLTSWPSVFSGWSWSARLPWEVASWSSIRALMWARGWMRASPPSSRG